MADLKYKNILLNILKQLKILHRRFLELERCEAEKYFERKFSPFEFLQILTQDINFKWLYPMSAIIADVDALTDEADQIFADDLKKAKEDITKILMLSRIQDRYQHHLLNDPEFTLLHANLVKSMKSEI